MTCGVYRVVCVPNGRMYYGSSNDIEVRWKNGHVARLRIKRHTNAIFQNCWNKHGEQAFRWEIVEVLPEDQLLAREQHYLDLNFQNKATCMNIARAAGAPMRGRTVSAVTRRRISQATRGRKLTEETKQRMRKPKHAEHGAKVRASLTGVRHTDERRANNKAAQPKRAVIGTNMATGEEIRFESLMDAHAAGFVATNVMRCCDEEKPQYKGYQWRDVVPVQRTQEEVEAHRARLEAARLRKNQKNREKWAMKSEDERHARAVKQYEIHDKNRVRDPLKVKERKAKYYANNRERLLAKQKAYNEARKDAGRAGVD